MQIKIKRVDKNLPLPAYKTKGAAGLDLSARIDVKILPGKIGYIPLNVILKIPKDCFVLLAARGSTHKLGIMPANAIGIGDADFCGDEDEYLLAALNITKKTVVIKRGVRIAQLLVLRYEKVKFQEITKAHKISRGKFGSTGQL
ncbi:MAG: dUTP diphosphatase [Candidatus Buchananbacteria bacterium]